MRIISVVVKASTLVSNGSFKKSQKFLLMFTSRISIIRVTGLVCRDCDSRRTYGEDKEVLELLEGWVGNHMSE